MGIKTSNKSGLFAGSGCDETALHTWKLEFISNTNIMTDQLKQIPKASSGEKKKICLPV